MTDLKPARVRIAPSPTGRFHLGGARTALYNYLLARQTGGQFILRLEDTDTRRYVPGSEQEIIDSLHWLGLDWDEGFDIGGPHAPYRQSERKEIYQTFASQLIASGHAYYCFCSPDRLEKVRQGQIQAKIPARYDGTCRRLDPDEAARRVASGEPHVVRFKMPAEGSVTGVDRLRGPITFDNQALDDSIIIKSDGLALYHLAALVDDHLMDITHVMRGSEWLSTFPLHVHIYQAFGWQQPEWLHLSLFLKPSGKGKMSKRESAELMQDGHSIFVGDLEALGYVPEALVNWIGLMGWSYDDHTEFFSLQDFVDKFSLERLNPSPAAINFSKLDHFNGLHIRSLEVADLARRIRPFLTQAGYEVDDEKLLKIVPIIQVRIASLDEAAPMAGFFFKDRIDPTPESLIGKNLTPAESAMLLRRSIEVLGGLPEITHETAEAPMRDVADELGVKAGTLFGILRSAVTGQTVSPPLFESMEIIGKETVLARLAKAVEILEGIAD
jgi:glutamyl-tRNA synthetase